MIRLLTLTLVVALSGCAAAEPITVVQKMYPPAVLLEATPIPPFASEKATSGVLVQYLIDLQEAVDLCNSDKRAVKEWTSEQ